MAIVKRLGPAERFEQSHGKTWRAIKSFPLVKAFIRKGSGDILDDPAHLSAIIAMFSTPRWISEAHLDFKTFMYVVELVCSRAGLPGLLPEDVSSQLRKHMSTLTVEERMNAMEGVSFGPRQIFIWDIPEFLRRYPRPGTLSLAPSSPVAARTKPIKPRPAGVKPKPIKPPPAALRKRLAKHR